MGNNFCHTETTDQQTELDVVEGSPSPKPQVYFNQQHNLLGLDHHSAETTSDSPRRFNFPGQILNQASTKSGTLANQQSASQLCQSGSNRTLMQQQQQQVPFSMDKLSRLRQIATSATAPKLTIRQKNCNTSHENTILKFTPLGLVDGSRGAEDGSTFFGTLRNSMPNADGQFFVINDYVLPPFRLPNQVAQSPAHDSANTHRMSQAQSGCHRQSNQPKYLLQKEDRHRGQQVEISFNPDSMDYRIQDLGRGLGAYMRVDHSKGGEPYVLRDNQIINVGSSLLLVSLMDSLDEETSPALLDVTNQQECQALRKGSRIPLLKIKVVGGPAYGQFFVRNPLDRSKHHILGRNDDCEILVNDPILSKRHCTFMYVAGSSPLENESDFGPKASAGGPPKPQGDFDGHWVLKDGSINASMNGTWVYLSQETPIGHKMCFKASEIVFEATLH